MVHQTNSHLKINAENKKKRNDVLILRTEVDLTETT